MKMDNEMIKSITGNHHFLNALIRHLLTKLVLN